MAFCQLSDRLLGIFIILLTLNQHEELHGEDQDVNWKKVELIMASFPWRDFVALEAEMFQK